MASPYHHQQTRPPPQPQQTYPGPGSDGYYAAPGPAPAPAKFKSPMSVWWPLGALVGWVVLLAAGGGLIGGSIAKGTTRTCSNPYYTYACRGEGPDRPMLHAGIALCGLAALCHLLFWVLLIVYFVKRFDARHRQMGPQQLVVYTQPAPNYAWQQQQQQQQQPINRGVDETAATSPALTHTPAATETTTTESK